MNETTVEEFRKKHIENYKNAVLEILKNNSTVLFEDDLMSLLKKPPLDSMDIIKCKFLDLAKKQKVVLNTEELDRVIDKYRETIILSVDSWKELRIKELGKTILEFSPKKETDVIKFNKKDFIPINKKLRKSIKEKTIEVATKKIVNNVKYIFTKNTNSDRQELISNEITKFLTTTYPKQLLESVDFKILVKDTTFMNGVREQSERYIFTKMNSYLLNEKRFEEQK